MGATMLHFLTEMRLLLIFVKGHRSRQSPYTCGPYIRTGSGALFKRRLKIKILKGERYGYHRRA
jgi:hypothetical protein